jgi:hypothetical protein
MALTARPQLFSALTATLILALSASAALAEDTTQLENLARSQETQSEIQKRTNVIFGKSVDTDYVAKHFSMLFGAAMMNQFQIVEGTGDPAIDGFDCNDGALCLGRGNATAQGFIEGNFRYRWAWLHRAAPVHELQPTVVQTQRALDLAQRRFDSASDAQAKAAQAATLRKVEAAKDDLEAAQEREWAAADYMPRERRAVEIEIAVTNSRAALAGSREALQKEETASVADLSIALIDASQRMTQLVDDAKAQQASVTTAKVELNAAKDELKQANREAAVERRKKLRDTKKDELRRASLGMIDAPALQQLVEQQELSSQAKDEGAALLTRLADPRRTSKDSQERLAWENDRRQSIQRARFLEDTLEFAIRESQLGRSAVELRTPQTVRDLRTLEFARATRSREKGIVNYMWRGTWTDGKVTSLFVPDNWSVRLGYLFSGGGDGGSISAASEIVTASDLYIQLGMGYDLVRWSLPTSRIEDVPIRASIGLEFNNLWFSEKAINDIHQRVFLGLGASFGIPLKYKEADRDKPPPIVELVVRIGAVYTETPQYVEDARRELQLEHLDPKFAGAWGAGLDAEFNIPITKSLGYLVLRGGMNAGYDPNPWAVTIGWTIPLSSFGNVLAGLGG